MTSLQKYFIELNAIPYRHVDDCVAIIYACNLYGVSLTPSEAYLEWEIYSSKRDAQWMTLPGSPALIWKEITSTYTTHHDH